MKIFLDLLRLCIIFFVCSGILIVLMFKLLEYKVKKINKYDDEILLDNEWNSLTEIQLKEKEKHVIKKITRYSFVELIFSLVLIFTIFDFFIVIQNNYNIILVIIAFIIEVVTLIVVWIRKRVLKRERYKCLTLIDKKEK